VTGVEREWRTAPTPGAFADAPALYEINLDGSKQFRKLFEAQPNQSPALINPRGTKAAIEAFVDGKYLFFIYELPAWKLLHRWELNKLTQAHCPDCLPLSYGWLASGDRLFFDLALGDEDLIDPKNHNIPGTYFVSEDGGDLGSISSETGRLQLSGYIRSSVAERSLIAQLPNGSYLFQEYAAKKGSPGNQETFLVISSPDSKSQTQFPQKRLAGTYHLSPSEMYLAYIEERRLTPNFQTEPHLWGRDLQSGEEKELFVAPSPESSRVSGTERGAYGARLDPLTRQAVPLRGADPHTLALFLASTVTYILYNLYDNSMNCTTYLLPSFDASP
jgi:hypothetical protein